jgi:hypothetical protein
VNVRYTLYPQQKVAQAEFKHSRTSFGEAGAIVATVGAASLSLIVPVAEAVPEAILKSSLFSSIVSAVVGTLTVPVVAADGYSVVVV